MSYADNGYRVWHNLDPLFRRCFFPLDECGLDAPDTMPAGSVGELLSCLWMPTFCAREPRPKPFKGPPVSGRRLYVVHVSREALVLAESGEAACKPQHDIERWEESLVRADLWGGEDLPGWTDECLVYGATKDTTLAEAKQEQIK